MEEYEAVVYDLDGTLVGLDVDWDAVASDVAAVLSDRGVDVEGEPLWEMLELSVETGHRDAVEAAITEHELAGAEEATRLALADALPHRVPVGVCSLNSEAACRRALAVHDVAAHVDVVVGRDTVGSFKPDPASLVAAVDRLDADPDAALFVGDSANDRLAAERAGIDFQWVETRIE